MNIQLLQTSNGHSLIRIAGDVLMENSKDFYNGVRELIEKDTELRNLTLDFGKVQFMDSSGIGALIKLTSELKKTQCQVNIISLNKNLSAVFQLSGISSIIKIKTAQDFCKDHPEFQGNF